jgi:putative transposase
MSLRRQCALVGVSRGSWYDEPVGDNEANLPLMRLRDEQSPCTPFFGVKRMTAWLARQGHLVNAQRVRRLLRTRGWGAIHPGPKTSHPPLSIGSIPIG